MRGRSKWWLLMVSVSLGAAAWAAGSGYHVITTYKVGGDGGWDYLTTDSDARHIFISRGTHVMVVDADSGKTSATSGHSGRARDRAGAGPRARVHQQRARRHSHAFSI